MTNKIAETKVIREYNPDSFARRINELIEQGWEMKGNYHTGRDVGYSQIMVRYKDVKGMHTKTCAFQEFGPDKGVLGEVLLNEVRTQGPIKSPIVSVEVSPHRSISDSWVTTEAEVNMDMDRTISEYKLLWDEGYSSLGNQVKRASADGWELYGNPFTSQGVVGQAVVKYFEDKKPIPERHVNSFTFTIFVGGYYKVMEKIHDMDGRGVVHRYSVDKDNPLKYIIDIEVYDEGYREFLEWAASERNN